MCNIVKQEIIKILILRENALKEKRPRKKVALELYGKKFVFYEINGDMCIECHKNYAMEARQLEIPHNYLMKLHLRQVFGRFKGIRVSSKTKKRYFEFITKQEPFYTEGKYRYRWEVLRSLKGTKKEIVLTRLLYMNI
ncbi:hypothetical protein MHBO_000963 [Bonamia ostreae]|uniref:Uncharacterized protein n=1 Tax=Bonamia ostreae TaxID=126728 RepID=A0ABV2AHE6_9EUKA